MLLLKSILAAAIAAGLAPAFAGGKVVIDIPPSRETVSKLEKLLSLRKDNFEKTADFTKRLCAQTFKELGISDQATVTFGLAYGKYATSARYDADKQAFVFFIDSGSIYHDAGKGQDTFKWNTKFDPYVHRGIGIFKEYMFAPKTYSGTNAFGVSKDVKVGSKVAAVLYFPSTNYMTQEITYSSKPEDARRIENDLRVAVSTRIRPPCFVSGAGREPPTMDYPYDYTLSEVGIVIAPNPDWIIYLDSTKEIVKQGKFR